MDDFDSQLNKALRLGRKEREREVNLGATMCEAILKLAAVQRTGSDPNALLRTLKMGEFGDWEGHLLDAKSLLSAIE